MHPVRYVYDDGGRAKAGYKGSASDCVARAVAIAADLPYEEVYKRLASENASQRRSKRDSGPRKKTAREGIHTSRKWFDDYMLELGFRWVSCMSVGTGCHVHLRSDQLPENGRLVLRLSRHCAAYVDGVLRDTTDCSRDGNRCVYGYWIQEGRGL